MSFQPAPRRSELGWFGFDDAIRAHARHRPEHPAFIDGDRSCKWREFHQGVARAAEALMRLGVGQGERVALLSSNSIVAYEAMFGIVRAGGVVTPISTLLPAPVQARLLADSGARILLAESGHLALARDAVRLLAGVRLYALEDGDHGADSFATLAASCPGTFCGLTPSPDDPITIVYSSGTTGVPKGIFHTHGSRLGLAWQFGAALGITSQSRTLVSTPPSSNGTMIVLLPTVYTGGTCILTNALSADEFHGLLEAHAPTHAFVVPTQMKTLFEDARTTREKLASLRCMLSSGAPVPAPLKQRLLEHAGHCFHEAWGFSEGVATIIYPEEIAVRPGSVGRPFPGTELRLIDADGAEVHTDAGEIVGRSIMMMKEYYNRPDENKAIRWTDAEGTLFYRTGDIGKIDPDGYLTLLGRRKEMIISGGLNVYPIDIESTLLEHADVDDAAVVGVPHEKWGEVPVAFVLAKRGAAVDADRLRAWTNERVGKHQRLADVVLCTSDFPRNALGKVLKSDLRSVYRAGPG